MDKCDWYVIAREQRKTEVANGKGLSGTMRFEDIGCYACNGNKPLCDYYLNSFKTRDA